MTDLHRLLGSAVGGEPGSRLAEELAVPTSGDTILRRVRRRPGEPEPIYRSVGIGDFALRKGHTYGTILIDPERGRVIDLFDGRDGAAVQTWLNAHPDIEVITRDRRAAYANAAAIGAPQATRVADRWHLLKNLREAVERLSERSAGAIREAVAAAEPARSGPVTAEPANPPAAPPDAGSAATGGRRQRSENHRRVHDRHRRGLSSRQIVRHLRLSRTVVRRYLRTDRYLDGRGNRPRRS